MLEKEAEEIEKKEFLPYLGGIEIPTIGPYSGMELLFLPYLGGIEIRALRYDKN